MYETDPRALEEQRIKIRRDIVTNSVKTTGDYSEILCGESERVRSGRRFQHLLLSKSSVLMKGRNVVQRINMTQLNP